MNSTYRTKLTSKDLYVLASLLKKEFIVGVEGLTLVQEIPFQREGISFVVRSLEERGLIKYDLNGILKVDPTIRYVIDMISDPKKVGMLHERGGQEKKQVEYRFYDREGTVSLVRDPQAGCYEISVGEAVSPEEDIKSLSESYTGGRALAFKENILLEELMLVKDYIKEFREVDGREYLKRTVHNGASLDVIMDILRGRGETIVVRQYDRKGYRLELEGIFILAESGGYGVKMNCEDNVIVEISIYGT